ncbi:protein SMG9 isoform X2 [Lagopus leucura]|uniref:protein SMG9 isoform X2 n=1 Tax=Lagopus leucura TaxID=30410 RepID=UPI001C670B82|nr:protein SMG9 isoform X2 [Lagopus leucura]
MRSEAPRLLRQPAEFEEGLEASVGRSRPQGEGEGKRRTQEDAEGHSGAAAMSDSGQSPAPGVRRRWPREKEGDGSGDRREPTEEPGALLPKTPIILAKPPAERQVKAAAGPAPPPPGPAPPIVLMKARGEEGRAGVGAGEGAAIAPPREREGPRPTQPVYQLHGRGLPPPGAMDPVAGQARLAAPEKMKSSIKLVDEQMNWCDSAIEFLLDQTDVLVVGVLGLQGTGKSTLMSLLAANQPEEDPRAFVFRPQSPELKERGGSQTCGIDFFITQERVVFLDTQPILSPSILDHLINNDRKLPPEYSLPHTYVEMQLYGGASSRYRSLPSSSPSATWCCWCRIGSLTSVSTVFIQNRARPEAFCPRRLQQMHGILDRLMAHSHLKYKGSLSMLDCGLFPGLPEGFLPTEVNLFLLPPMEAEAEDAPPRTGFTTLPASGTG